jgi:UDP-N-acetylglucosamine---dolichyl-phosphate N-acetylglucosaminyltransferase
MIHCQSVSLRNEYYGIKAETDTIECMSALKKIFANPQICIIIPAFNEASIIQKVTKDAIKTFKKSEYSISVVVVNDGSKDLTPHKAKKGGAIVIDHIVNTGAGGATSTGIRYAEINNFDIAATMDADGQHDPEDVLRGIKVLLETKADLLIGSRLIDSKGMSRVKVIGNRGLGFITYLLFGVASTDSQSGLRLFSRHAIENLRWETPGYEFCSEMLWRAKQQKMNIKEYSIKAIYTEYSKAKGQNNWNAVNIIKSLLKRRISEFLR